MGEEEITSVERLVAEARRKAAPGGIYGTQMREKVVGGEELYKAIYYVDRLLHRLANSLVIMYRWCGIVGCEF